MSDSAYDHIRYSTVPNPGTHPDRLAAVGSLFGMSPAPVTHCRVLEIGTGDGSNLVPMAYELPESRFLGIDLAAGALAEGRRAIAALELDNIALEVADLCDIGADAGEFDYIVAHGVYSWVSPEVRDRLMAVCGERLAPGGIALVSYNAYPGWHLRRMLREMMLYDGRGVEEPPERIARARRFLEFLRGGGLLPAAYQELIESEVRAGFERGDAGLFHDDLAEFNEPAWFHEFVAHARRHRLAYVGEAEPHEMFDLRGALEGFEGGAIEREQYLDFLKLRRFRQTLLCREEVTLDRNAGPERMDRFLFSAPAQRSGGHPERGDSPPFYEGNRGVKITAGGDAAERVAGALGDAFPLPVAFEELLPYAGCRDTLREVAWMFVVSGFADLHVHDFPCEETVTERPVASRLARYQAAASRRVTNLSHRAFELDEIGRQLLLLLDGTRDREAIARDLAAKSGVPYDEVRRTLGGSLDWMARSGLLEA